MSDSPGRGGTRRRTPAKTVEGYLADARTAFEGALKRVSADVEDAQAEFDRVKDKQSKDLAALKARHAKELAAACSCFRPWTRTTRSGLISSGRQMAIAPQVAGRIGK